MSWPIIVGLGFLVLLAVGIAFSTSRVTHADEEIFFRMVTEEARLIQAIHHAATADREDLVDDAP